VQVKEVRIEELPPTPGRSDVATVGYQNRAARTREEGAGRWAEEKAG